MNRKYKLSLYLTDGPNILMQVKVEQTSNYRAQISTYYLVDIYDACLCALTTVKNLNIFFSYISEGDCDSCQFFYKKTSWSKLGITWDKEGGEKLAKSGHAGLMCIKVQTLMRNVIGDNTLKLDTVSHSCKCILDNIYTRKKSSESTKA